MKALALWSVLFMSACSQTPEPEAPIAPVTEPAASEPAANEPAANEPAPAVAATAPFEERVDARQAPPEALVEVCSIDGAAGRQNGVFQFLGEGRIERISCALFQPRRAHGPTSTVRRG